MRDKFIENYNQFLNNQLTITLLKSKEELINLKNQLLKDLKIYLYNSIKEKIDKNYLNYINFLLDLIKKISKNIDYSIEIIIFFNLKDYNYFNQNSNKIKNIFKNPITIKQVSDDFLGGFKVALTQDNIFYDYTIDNIIDKNSTLIEMEFSNVISDNEYIELDLEFEELIKKKKQDIEEYLREYDRD
ncbi:MAG: hypothetical protein ACTSUT_20465 [Promethearchaeota archaeon]